MSGYEIEVGKPEQWVTVTPFGPSQANETAVAGWHLTCARCRQPEHVYRLHCEGDRRFLAKRVEHHNRCAAQVAA